MRAPSRHAPGTAFATLRVAGRDVRLEYAWVGGAGAGAPLVVFLHEGLGSLAMWKDYPAALCGAAGVRGLVYSREGYGASTPRPPVRPSTSSAKRWLRESSTCGTPSSRSLASLA